MTCKKQTSQKTQQKASNLSDRVRFLRAEIEHAAQLFALMEAGNTDEVVEFVNAQGRDYAQACILIRRSLLTTIVLILCRAFDEHNNTTTVSFKQTIELAKDQNIQSYFEAAEDSKDLFQKTFSKWKSLTVMANVGSLDKLALLINASPGDQRYILEEIKKKHGLSVVLKNFRNWTLAHNEPKKAHKSPKPFINDLRGLLSLGIELVDSLSAATGSTTVSVRHTLDIWSQKGDIFWKRVPEP